MQSLYTKYFWKIGRAGIFIPAPLIYNWCIECATPYIETQSNCNATAKRTTMKKVELTPTEFHYFQQLCTELKIFYDYIVKGGSVLVTAKVQDLELIGY